MEKQMKVISYIYKVCTGKDCDDGTDGVDGADGSGAAGTRTLQFDHSENTSSGGGRHHIGEILNILQYNLNQDILTLPPAPKTKLHSFITLLNHKRNKNSAVNMNTIISDGYKVYNQYISNQHDMSKLNNFRQQFAFENYKAQIPHDKSIKTKHGHQYNVDDLVLLMLANNDHDPNDHEHSDYLFANETEENIILGHPGLSEELRSQYIATQKKIQDNKTKLCAFINSYPDILDCIGQFGILFMNFRLSNETYKMFIHNFMNKIGDDLESPLLQYELFKTITFKSILISAANEKPSPEEFGYYLILLYFSIFDICSMVDAFTGAMLPYFRNITSKCNTPVYAGTVIDQPIDIKKFDNDNPSSSVLKMLGRHSVFVYIPRRFPNQLVLTSYAVSNALREDFGDATAVTEMFTKQVPYYLNLDDYCAGFRQLLDHSGIDNQNQSNELVKLYFSLQSDLNQ